MSQGRSGVSGTDSKREHGSLLGALERVPEKFVRKMKGPCRMQENVNGVITSHDGQP